jgi:phosphoenolpyruvate carboxykinase (ATP)
MDIEHTRVMVRAALSGELDRIPTVTDPTFRVEVPTACPGVPSDLLQPRNTWPDPAAYDAQAARLAQMFDTNFAAYADGVSEGVRRAGPVVAAPRERSDIRLSDPGEG